MAHAQHSSFRPMAEVPFRPVRQLSEYKGKGASASTEVLSKICVQFDARKKKIIKLCSAPRMTFRAWFYRTDPQNIGGQFGTLSVFSRNTFRKRTSQKSPEMYFRPKSFRTIFEKRTTVYSLAAQLLGLAKSIYYEFYSRKN